MSDTDDISTDDKATEVVEVKVEDDPKEPVNTESQGTGEDTSKNDPSKQESPDEKRSAGQVIANLGNEKKAMAEKLVILAQGSETSRLEVKKLLSEDPSTASYLKSKFGTAYDQIVGDEPVEKGEEIDIEKIREQERAKAEANIIKTHLAQNQLDLITQRAKELGFTSEEFDTYKAKVELLGGDEQAIEDAALIVNRVKATAKSGNYQPDGGEADKPKTITVTITPGLDEFAQERNLDRGEFAKGVQKVRDLHTKDVHGRDVMTLPSL